MKTLEELGISPWPWFRGRTANGIGVYDAEEFALTDSEDGFSSPDARIAAAAPEMYEALREAVVERCTECHEVNDYESDIGTEWQMCRGCPARKWRDALAKAAGESEDAE